MKPFYSETTGVKLEYDVDTTRQRLKETFRLNKGFAYLRCRAVVMWGDAYHSLEQAQELKEQLDLWERDH